MSKLNKKRIFSTLILSALLTFSLTGCKNNGNIKQENEVTNNQIETKDVNSKVYFIDTGNSDCILIENNNEFALIDGGDVDDDELVLSKLKEHNVDKLKYLFITHPHADHIGALDTVINNYEVGNIYVGNGVSNTKTYESVLTSIKNKNYKLQKAKESESLSLGNGIIKTFNTNWNKGDDLNNYSLVLKYTNGNDDFLLTGDAEKEVEISLLGKIGEVEVLKAGHHGSHSSSSLDFIEETKPKEIVMTVGKDNKYGHPHQETLSLFKNNNIYRSDINGDITFSSTGNGYSISTDRPDAEVTISNNQEENSKNEKVYATPKGKTYHRIKSCSTLSKSKEINELEENKALLKGLNPCKSCN